jgi:hypothetical protein
LIPVVDIEEIDRAMEARNIPKVGRRLLRDVVLKMVATSGMSVAEAMESCIGGGYPADDVTDGEPAGDA